MLYEALSTNNTEQTTLKVVIRKIRTVGRWWNKNILSNIDLSIKDMKEKLNEQDISTNQDTHSTDNITTQLDKLY